MLNLLLGSVSSGTQDYVSVEEAALSTAVREDNTRDTKSRDILADVVGRQLRVPSSWFGFEYQKINPDKTFILDIEKVLPETQSHNRRLLLTYQNEAEVYHCARADFAKVVKPYLLPVTGVTSLEQSGLQGGLTRASSFNSLTPRATVDDNHTYLLLGT